MLTPARGQSLKQGQHSNSSWPEECQQEPILLELKEAVSSKGYKSDSGF